MRTLKRAAALLLTAILMTSSVCVQAEAKFPGAFSQTPEEIILSAMEVYSWFTISPLDVDTELTNDSGSLFRVADEALCSWNTVSRLLDFTFCEEIASYLFEYSPYEVEDGLLYAAPGESRVVDQRISEVEYTESYADEERIVYTVTVNYVNVDGCAVEPDVLEFVREKVNGQMVFTQFPFFW